MAEEKRYKKINVSVRQILSGTVLFNENVLKQLPTIGLLTFLGLVMISNRYQGEKVVRKVAVYQDSVRDLRSESATIDAELMNLSRYSVVLKECQKRGLDLERPKEPPYKVVVED
jgi:hypothetical protein